MVLGMAALWTASGLLSLVRGFLRWSVERVIAGPGPTAMKVMAVRREAQAALSEEGKDERTLRRAQKELVSQVYEFGESTVEEVMVSRSLIVGVPAEATVGQAVALAEEHQFSRYPVYRGSLDSIDGIIHVFDLLSAKSLDGPITPYLRPVTFAPAGKKCDEILGELRKSFQHAAIVVDEFGGTAGWVTVENLLEELVGDIRDEHDVEEEWVRPIGRRSYLVDARMKVQDLNRTLHVEIPEGDYETLGGFLLEEMDRIPGKGERIDLEGVRLEVAQADPRRIVKVMLEVIE
jgi:CBS domain containing-hemolysin-like protein